MNFIIPTLCITAIIGLVVVMVHEVCKPDVKDEYKLVWVRYWFRGQELYHKMPKATLWDTKSYLARLHGCRINDVEIQ